MLHKMRESVAIPGLVAASGINHRPYITDESIRPTADHSQTVCQCEDIVCMIHIFLLAF